MATGIAKSAGADADLNTYVFYACIGIAGLLLLTALMSFCTARSRPCCCCFFVSLSRFTF